MSSEPADLVVLGVVGRPHGLRGEVRVRPHNPGSELWPSLRQVWLRLPAGTVRQVGVARMRQGERGLVLALDGVEGRDAAEALRGAEVCAPRSAFAAPGEDEWYVHDLIGLSVRDEGGNVVGEVSDVIAYPSVDCLCVRAEDGAVREVPMMDPWLLEVDLEAGEVRVGGLEDVPVVPPGGRR